MKKVLFATTALVASAGIAAAQDVGVALSGSAEMGIIGGDNIDLQFHTDIDVTFSMSGTTDNGLTFGASIDLDESDGSGSCSLPGGAGNLGVTCSVSGGSAAFGNTGQGGESIFLSGDFGTITMGDTDGGFDWALQEALAGGGSINSDEEHGGYNGNGGLDGTYDGQIARYDYSFGDFAFAASVEIDDSGTNDPVFGVGVKYSGDLGGVNLGVGIGYQTTDSAVSDDAMGISLDAKFDNGLRAIMNYSEVNNVEHMAIALGYSFDAVSLGVNYAEFDGGNSGFGLAAAYDLGGGAAIQFGYGNTDLAGGGSTDSYSLGVSMSF